MNRQKAILFGITLALIAFSAGLLTNLQSHQRLSPPGVKTQPIPGSRCLEVELPAHVLDYSSQKIPIDEVTTNALPKDTSFGLRVYQALDHFRVQTQVVLMGTDRTSMHKPQFCLEGQGWHIDQNRTSVQKVPIEQPFSYELPVVRLITTKQYQGQVRSGIYVYWYVTDDAMSASVSGLQRMWMMASKLIRTGVLQRWAYVSYFTDCAPGQEEATFARMKELIAASVPKFQLYPHASANVTAND